MTSSTLRLSAFLLGTSLLVSACSVAPEMSPQEQQIKSDLAVEQYMPSSREMRDAIETQPIFAQAAFWSNEYDINPGDLEAAIKLAAAVRRLGNPRRAIEITQTTRALYPRDPYLLAEYAAALIADERALDAVPVLDEGLARTPAYGRLWSLKGAALDQQERYGEARKHYARALQITPNDPNVMANIGLSHALAGDAATAEGWLRRASAQPGASDSVRQNLILVLQLLGKTEEADRMMALSGPNRSPTASTPTSRPAAPAAVATPARRTAAATPRRVGMPSRGPGARMMTGPAPGQEFKSASEAARAMAARRQSSQSAVSTYEGGRVASKPLPAETMATRPQTNTAPVVSSADTLDRIARSVQPRRPQPRSLQQPLPAQMRQPQAAPPAGYRPQGPATGGYPAPYPPQAASRQAASQQQGAPTRRDRQRRRR